MTHDPDRFAGLAFLKSNDNVIRTSLPAEEGNGIVLLACGGVEG